MRRILDYKCVWTSAEKLLDFCSVPLSSFLPFHDEHKHPPPHPPTNGVFLVPYRYQNQNNCYIFTPLMQTVKKIKK
jgi:hypothetical protein